MQIKREEQCTYHGRSVLLAEAIPSEAVRQSEKTEVSRSHSTEEIMET